MKKKLMLSLYWTRWLGFNSVVFIFWSYHSHIKFFKDILTEADGTSYCPARLLLIVGSIAFIFLSFYAVYHGKEFDPQNWGLGYGGLLAGGGGWILMKGKVE